MKVSHRPQSTGHVDLPGQSFLQYLKDPDCVKLNITKGTFCQNQNEMTVKLEDICIELI